MKYKSVDEIDTFSFRDATITRCNYSEKQGILVFELDGAIVRRIIRQMSFILTDMSAICRSDLWNLR